MQQPEEPATHAGMPEIGGGPPLSRFEFWPAWRFYAPIWVWIIMLMIRHRGIRLPLVVNTGFPAGGLVGERKSELFDRMRGPERHRLPDYIVVNRTARSVRSTLHGIRRDLSAAGLSYPLVAKPDVGCRGAGVRPVRCDEDLQRYVEGFPLGASFLLQAMIDVEGEAGVFYSREPGQRRGRIHSLTLKYFPHVTGDGRSTLRELIMGDRRAGKIAHLYLARFAHELDNVPGAGERKRLVFSGSHSKGAIFRNGNAYITPAMCDRFDRIADSIEGFHFGRFDVRFGDFAAFQRGEGFHILEYNGAGAEMTHIWDSRTSLRDAWVTLCRQYALLFRIARLNRSGGAKPDSWAMFYRRWRMEKALSRSYPATG